MLSLIGISQTRFTTVELIVALLALGAIAADGWRRTCVPACRLDFSFRPLGCSMLSPSNTSTGETPHTLPLRCTRASVYPWLVVLHFDRDPDAAGALPAWLRRGVVLMPDSLADGRTDWRRLLVWARLTRRQLANR